MNGNNPPEPVEADQKLANYIAMVIRNAVCTALHTFNNYEHADAATRFVDYNFAMIAKYWEQPELLDGYVRMWEKKA